MWRQELGDFCSVVCFKAAIMGMEEALGEKAAAIALTTAGRARGKQLIKDLMLSNQPLGLETLADKMRFALGKEGTRLCAIEKIAEEDELIKVYVSETLCTAGEEPGSSRNCTFTLGVIWGVLEGVTRKRLQGKQTESVLRGGSVDVFEFNPI